MNNKERRAFSLPGLPVFAVLTVATIALVLLFGWYIVNVFAPGVDGDSPLLPVVGFVGLLVALIGVILLYTGLTPVNPNEARALVLFGRYDGTVRDQGLQWVNPLTERRRISVRVRNFETSKLKVNDTAEALFEVDDFENFVHVQAESALRNLSTSHPYDAHGDEAITLRSNPVEISQELRTEIQDRLERAGVEVIEARISHLAYAPEIANAMLRRQQANAVIAARTRIVEGAVGMVEMALEQLSAKGVVTLDEERKASMVSNLLVVLCSEHETQPVVNTGTLYA
jgi:hypothetical protein